MAIKSYILGFTIALMLLTPVVNITGPLAIKSLDFYATAFFLAYASVTAFSLGKLHYRNILQSVFGAYALLLAHMFFLEIVYGYGDTSGITLVIRSAIWVLAALGCAQLLIRVKQERALEFFIKVVIVCAIIQGFVFWGTFLSPGFRDIMSIFFYRDWGRGAEHLIMLRTPGFVPTGGDGLSMNQALLATVGLIGAYLYFPKSRYLFLLVGMLLISMLSTAFAGRSGLYLGVLFAIIIIATRKRNFQITRNFQWIIIISIVLAIPVVLFAQQIGVYGYNLVGKFGYEYPVVRLLRGFIDMQATGTYSDRTIETLLGRMVVLPEEPLRFLIGNNAFGRQEATYVHTDVGYFRMWHGFGLIGLIIFLFGVYFLPVLYLFRLRLMTIRVIYNKRLKDMIIVRFQMVFFVLVFGLIGHYKIFFISTRIYLFVFFVLLFLVCNQYQVLRTQMMSGVKHMKKSNLLIIGAFPQTSRKTR